MKKRTAILFLFVLFVSQVGYYFIYLFQQHEIKEAVEQQLLQRIPNEQLVAIDINANKHDIEWEEEGREFSFNGEMFDVARIEEVNGRQIAYCLNDKKESELLNDLAKTVKSGNDNTSNGKGSAHTIKFQLVDFIQPAIQKSIVIIDQHTVNSYAGYNVGILSSTREVDLPPPKLNFMSKFSQL